MKCNDCGREQSDVACECLPPLGAWWFVLTVALAVCLYAVARMDEEDKLCSR